MTAALIADEIATRIFLYSDIGVGFYERLGFRTLPQEFRTKDGSTLMASMIPHYDTEELAKYRNRIPPYF